MLTSSGSFSLARNMRSLLISLLVVSTILYVVGITLERNSEVGATPMTHQESGESQEGHSEVQTTPTAPTNQLETGHQEALFGINLESPWFMAAAVLGAVALIGALLRFERTALLLVIAFAIVATLLDILEVVTQLNRANPGIVVVAVLVALAHIALGVTAALALSRYQVAKHYAESGSATT